MKTSLAAIFDGHPEHLETRRFEIPDLQPGEILVRIHGCTLCASDQHSFSGRRVVPVPTILGHEIVGEIDEFGGNSPCLDFEGKPLQIGDRVVWSIVASCGKCHFCLRNLPQKCLQGTKYGHEALRPGRELLGGLAEYCLLVQGTSVVRVPESLPLDVIAPAGCAAATVEAVLEAAGELQDRSVCILGCGMLGLTASAMASKRGAANVVAIDPNPERRKLIRRFGATHAVSPEEFAGLARAVTESRGFDIVLELSGSTQGMMAVWPHVGIGGTVVLAGSVFPAPPAQIELERVVRGHLTIRGVHNYAPQHLFSAVTFLMEFQEEFPFSELVACWFPLSKAGQAFDCARDSRPIRVGVYTKDPPEKGRT